MFLRGCTQGRSIAEGNIITFYWIWIVLVAHFDNYFPAIMVSEWNLTFSPHTSRLATGVRNISAESRSVSLLLIKKH